MTTTRHGIVVVMFLILKKLLSAVDRVYFIVMQFKYINKTNYLYYFLGSNTNSNSQLLHNMAVLLTRQSKRNRETYV
jgi:hypothetical protein